MSQNKNLESYQLYQKIGMYGMFIFGALVALSTLAWNYYGVKVKEEEARLKSLKATEAEGKPPISNNNFNITGIR